jgi:hypothetical protein
MTKMKQLETIKNTKTLFVVYLRSLTSISSDSLAIFIIELHKNNALGEYTIIRFKDK